MSTYTIYSTHMDIDGTDEQNKIAAERLRQHLAINFPEINVIVQHNVSGVGCGYAGDNVDEGENIVATAERFDAFKI